MSTSRKHLYFKQRLLYHRPLRCATTILTKIQVLLPLFLATLPNSTVSVFLCSVVSSTQAQGSLSRHPFTAKRHQKRNRVKHGFLQYVPGKKNVCAFCLLPSGIRRLKNWCAKGQHIDHRFFIRMDTFHLLPFHLLRKRRQVTSTFQFRFHSSCAQQIGALPSRGPSRADDAAVGQTGIVLPICPASHRPPQHFLQRPK